MMQCRLTCSGKANDSTVYLIFVSIMEQNDSCGHSTFLFTMHDLCGAKCRFVFVRLLQPWYPLTDLLCWGLSCSINNLKSKNVLAAVLAFFLALKSRQTTDTKKGQRGVLTSNSHVVLFTQSTSRNIRRAENNKSPLLRIRYKSVMTNINTVGRLL